MESELEEKARVQGNKRFFVMSYGRTGSSLLSGILANAGANFNMPVTEDWDPKDGEYEPPILTKTFTDFRSIGYLLPFKRYSLLTKYKIDIMRSIAKKRLKHLLRDAEFSKASPQMVWYASRFGYRPSIIISYRRLADMARSIHIKTGDNGSDIAKNYANHYQDLLLLLEVYGGCTIDYDEIVSPSETRWANALSKITGFSTEKLIEQRDLLVKPTLVRDELSSKHTLYKVDACDEVYSRMATLRGSIISPSDRNLSKLSSAA